MIRSPYTPYSIYLRGTIHLKVIMEVPREGKTETDMHSTVVYNILGNNGETNSKNMEMK